MLLYWLIVTFLKCASLLYNKYDEKKVCLKETWWLKYFTIHWRCNPTAEEKLEAITCAVLYVLKACTYCSCTENKPFKRFLSNHRFRDVTVSDVFSPQLFPYWSEVSQSFRTWFCSPSSSCFDALWMKASKIHTQHVRNTKNQRRLTFTFILRLIERARTWTDPQRKHHLRASKCLLIC